MEILDALTLWLMFITIIYVVCMLAIVQSARRTSCDEEYEDEYEEDPTREELDELKAQLGIEKGSLQFKSGSVYHVVYDSAVRKHRWKRLGYYEELIG